MTRLQPADLPDDLPVKNNPVRALYHNPDLYRAFGRLAMQVHESSHLEPRTRELVVLWIAGELQAPYQWTQHCAATWPASRLPSSWPCGSHRRSRTGP